MKFISLHYYCTIVEQGQISKAAKLLNISQPPLSKYLKDLEEELGTTLIDRSGGKWEVTTAGKIFYAYAKETLDKNDTIVNRIRNIRRGYGVPLNIGASSFCMPLLQTVLPVLLDYYPDTHFRITVENSSALARDIGYSHIDIAVLAMPFDINDNKTILLRKLRFQAVFADKPEFSALPSPLPLDALKPYPLLVPRRPGLASYERIMAVLHSANIFPQIRIECTDFASLLNFVEDNLGVGVIPSLPAVTSRKVIVRSLADVDVSMQMAILMRPEVFLTPPLRMLIELLRDAFAEKAPTPIPPSPA